MTTADLSALSRSAGKPAHVPRPPSRALTRVLLPAAIIVVALVLVAYAARESLRPALSVTVAPVVLKVGGSSDRPGPVQGEVVQAPGWIEADPYDIGVPALASGVLKELL